MVLCWSQGHWCSAVGSTEGACCTSPVESRASSIPGHEPRYASSIPMQAASEALNNSSRSGNVPIHPTSLIASRLPLPKATAFLCIIRRRGDLGERTFGGGAWCTFLGVNFVGRTLATQQHTQKRHVAPEGWQRVHFLASITAVGKLSGNRAAYGRPA